MGLFTYRYFFDDAFNVMEGDNVTYQKLLLGLIASVLLFPFVKLFQFPTWLKRDLLALFTLAVIALFIWLGREAFRAGSAEKFSPGLTHKS